MAASRRAAPDAGDYTLSVGLLGAVAGFLPGGPGGRSHGACANARPVRPDGALAVEVP